MPLCFLFLSHALFSHKVWVLFLYLYIYTELIYFSYISGMARYIYFFDAETVFLPSDVAHWNPDGKLFFLSTGELCLGPRRQRFSYWNVKRPLLHGSLIYKSRTQRTVFGLVCLKEQGARLSNTALMKELGGCLHFQCLQFPTLLRLLYSTHLRDLECQEIMSICSVSKGHTFLHVLLRSAPLVTEDPYEYLNFIHEEIHAQRIKVIYPR